MSRKAIYLYSFLIVLAAAAFVALRHMPPLQNRVVAFYPLQERPDALAQTAEWNHTRRQASTLIRQVRENEEDHKSALALAAIYLREGRVTGQHEYYEDAALYYVDRVLARQPDNFEALLLKALLQLAQHQFDQGLATAAKAQKINPYNALVYGLQVDGFVEMGNYKAAVACADKMVSIRPDLRSYSRIAYLREIHGDYPGAIEAMQMAVEAGAPGEEPTAWTRVQLAHLYECTGDTARARMHYTRTLAERPGYPYAWAGLARLAMAAGDYRSAIGWCRKAAETSGDGVIQDQLAALYLLSGEKTKAGSIIRQRKKELKALLKKSDDTHADGELMELCQLEGDYKNALFYAQAEWRRRPDNIDVNHWVAWLHYKLGAPQKAKKHIDKALATGSRNPTLLCRAGLIYASAGDREKAREYLAEALQNNPVLDPELRAESQAIQRTLHSLP